MNQKTRIPFKLITLALLVVLATAGASYGIDVYLRADTVVKIMPDGRPIPMWGFAQDSSFGAGDGTVMVPGPQITIPPADPNLTIHLDNNLGVPVCIVIPGQTAIMTPVMFTDGQGRDRVQSFTHETPPGNLAQVDYHWNNMRPGTFIYHSGTHANVQVPMGLYGVAIKDANAMEAYGGVFYDSQVVLCYSEIDPNLNDAVNANDYGPGLGMTSTIYYRPQYFLVNGQPYSAGQPPLVAGEAGQQILLRLVNAGVETHVPVLDNLRASVIAEDAFPYDYPRDQHSIALPALQTKDALVRPGNAGTYAVYDRRLRLHNPNTWPGGMLAFLEVSAPTVVVLLDENFNDGDYTGWAIVDEGTIEGPSVWSAASGTMVQSSNIYGGSTAASSLPKPGTYAYYAAGLSWTDYQANLAIRSTDDDDIGVMFRYQDNNNYYRLSWDRSRTYRRLVKKQGGVFSLLAADSVPYTIGQTYQVQIIAQGALLEVSIDGAPVFSVTDGSLATGTIALYTWGNASSFFDNIVVTSLSAGNLPPSILSVTATPSTITDAQMSQLDVVANDPDAGPSPLSYHWNVPAGQGSVDNPTIANPIYTPPDVASTQTFTLTVEVSDGDATVVDTVDVTVSDAASPILLNENFNDGDFAGWTIVDEGIVDAPSAWSAASGTMAQSSNIYSFPTGAASLPKLGTYAYWTGGLGWTDYQTDMMILSSDNDTIGVMFRYQDSNNYYRFSWDRERNYRRLVKKQAGVFSLLAADSVPYNIGQAYQVQIIAQGPLLQVSIDNVPIFSVMDGSLAAGSIALYTWANTGNYFENILVQRLAAGNLPPSILSVTATPSTITDALTSQLDVVANDPDAGPGPLTYNWIVPVGQGSVDNPTIANPIYTPPDVASIQTFTLTVEVSDGDATSVDTVDVTVTDAASPILLDENFNDGDFAGWTIVDEGTIDAPSAWSAATGIMLQNSNIYAGSTAASSLPKPGTYAYYGAGLGWTDYRANLTIRSQDDDDIGVMFRYQDNDNYYRFSWDRQRNYRRLVKKQAGVFSLLAADSVPYNIGQTYQVQIIALGSLLEIWIDGAPVFSVTDGSLPMGTIALYTWGNPGSYFDDIVVE